MYITDAVIFVCLVGLAAAIKRAWMLTEGAVILVYFVSAAAAFLKLLTEPDAVLDFVVEYYVLFFACFFVLMYAQTY